MPPSFMHAVITSKRLIFVEINLDNRFFRAYVATQYDVSRNRLFFLDNAFFNKRNSLLANMR